MISHKAVGSMTLVIIAMLGIRALADEQTATDLYGAGVHAYFAHNYESAIALLNHSIKKNDGDPRAFFFRGLSQASLHGADAGLADFAKGADLEIYRQDDRLYDVNGALQRVQGGLRMALEKQRSTARSAAAQKKAKQDRIKYEELKRREDIVLYQPNRPVKKMDLQLPQVDLAGPDPFANGVAFSGGKEVASAAPVEPVVPPNADAMTDQRDPFAATAPVEPAKKQPNPFGDIPESRSPFGDITPEEPPTTEKKPVADTENPFGDGMTEVAPDDPVFDKNVRPELPPGMNVGGTIMELLGKTLSGNASEASNRDPISDDEPAAPPKTKPAPDDTGATPAKKPDPNRNPFD